MDLITEHHHEEWLPVHPEDVAADAPGGLSLHQAKLWALVLEARHLPSHLEQCHRGWQVLVPAVHFEHACRELRLYMEENRNWPPAPATLPPSADTTLVTISVLMLLATFYNVTLLDLGFPGKESISWVDAGSAQARLIIEGEWWRCLTALTLHADWLHLISNIAIGAIFIVNVCNDLGSGLGWSLLVACGFLGNLANAHLQLPSHNSIGSSTVVFAAVGVLGGLATVRSRSQSRKRWPLPVAAALSLLVLLGSEGKQTDLGAHLLGFAFGLLLGGAIARVVAVKGRPGPLLNALLGTASAAAMAGAWWLAVTRA